MLAKADLQEQLLATVLRTDRDGNLQIDDREASILVLRMKNHGGLEFNEERVRRALVKTNGSLPALLNILRQIGGDEDDDDDSKTKSSKGSLTMGDLRENDDEEVLVRVNERKFMESIKVNYSQASMISSIADSGCFDASKNSLLDNPCS